MAKNRTLDTLLENDHFARALRGFKQGWVFDSQETGQFPHYSNDLRSLPTHLQRLLNQKGGSRARASTLKSSSPSLSSSSSSSGHGVERERENRFGSATNPEDRGLKMELNRTEGYHIHTSCVQLAFVDSYTHQATLRTTSFVEDFPVHIWVFIPPSLLDKSLTNQEPAFPVTPAGGTHSAKVHDAMISFIAHAPQPIRAQLERLQLLFILRLKDSFTEFKNTLMRFLVLPKSSNKSAMKSKGEREERVNGQLDEKMPEMAGLRHSQSSDLPHIQDVRSTKVQSTSPGDPPVRGSTPSSVLSSSSSESDVSATISGCVVVESIEACILLPSVLKAQGPTSSRSGTPSGGAVSPRSPSTPLAEVGGNKKLPSMAEAAKRVENAVLVSNGEIRGSGNGVQEAEWRDLESNNENHSGEQAQVSMARPSSQCSQAGLTGNMMTQGSSQSGLSSHTGLSMSASSSTSPSPRISPAPSQTSLTSQTSQSSLSVSSNMSNVHSPSITSLPTLIESSSNRDSLTELTQSFNYPRGTPVPVPSNLIVHPPLRSYSASHLPHSSNQGSGNSAPYPSLESSTTHHDRKSITVNGRGRTSTPVTQERHSPVGVEVHQSIEGYSNSLYIAAASQMEGRERGRSNPLVHVTAIGTGGTRTVIETQYESKALWSESPHEETDFIIVERPQQHHAVDQGELSL